MGSNSTSQESIASQSDYGYVPTQWICIMFLVLFGASTALHLAQSIIFRKWWLILTAVVCGVMELVGWGARTWSSVSPLLLTPYIIQMTSTIMAPTFLIATNFIILEEIILQLGPQYSRLPPKFYKWLFLSCDLVSLTVQAVGGAKASSSADGSGNPDDGGHIMLGGIGFQMFTITVYAVLATEFFVRAFREKPVREVYATLDQSKQEAAAKKNPKLRLMIYGLLAMGLFIIIRSVYRTIELANGFEGKIIETEIWFNIFDGAMIVLAMYTLNFLHPGFLLRHDIAPMSRSPSEVSLTLANPHPHAEFEPEKPVAYGWSGSGAV